MAATIQHTGDKQCNCHYKINFSLYSEDIWRCQMCLYQAAFWHGHRLFDAALGALTLHFSHCQIPPSYYKNLPTSAAQSTHFCFYLISVGRLKEKPSQSRLMCNNEVQFLYGIFFLMALIHFFHRGEILWPFYTYNDRGSSSKSPPLAKQEHNPVF